MTVIADGSNRAFSWRVFVDAPRAAVWRLWSDVALWPEWDAEVRAAELDGPYQAGARGMLTPTRGQASHFYIEECAPGERTVVVVAMPMARLVITRQFVDGSVIEHAVAFEGPLAGLWAVVFGARFRAALPKAMEQVRVMAELAAREPKD